MALLGKKSRESLDKRAEALLSRGRTWRERIGRKVIEDLQLEAPPLFRIGAGGELERVDSDLRRRRRERAQAAVKKRPELSVGMQQFDAAIAGCEWDPGSGPARYKLDDRSGIGERTGASFVLGGDGVLCFRGGVACGWSPDETATEEFWLFDEEGSDSGDFRGFLDLHRAVRLVAVKAVSDRWIWDQLVAWMKGRFRSDSALSLSALLEDALEMEVDQWDLALRLDGMYLEEVQPEPESAPLSYPWLGRLLVDGKFTLSKVLDSLIPDRDRAGFENDDEWSGKEFPQAILKSDWLYFSGIEGDRYKALELCLKEVPELCGLMSVFASNSTPAERVPSVLRSHAEACAVLIPSRAVADGELRLKPLFLTELPRAFGASLPSSDLVLLPSAEVGNRFWALSNLSRDFHLLGSTDMEQRRLRLAIQNSIVRLARARREPDVSERLFLLVSALDALLVDADAKTTGRTHSEVFRERLFNLTAASREREGERAWTASLIARAWRARNLFAHGEIADGRLNDEELRQFESLAVKVVRMLFLGATTWKSIAQFRVQLDGKATEDTQALKSLDDYSRAIFPPEDGEPN